ncbi:GntR family transcriptional regulator [Mesorhizobium sp. M2E.F.Ca.ET.209.01.1.1]|uniref:GntR family transcriptional regulator n=1 Tax=Mesorhizobium sp. M2E.F.Ca.ET.209.01.1.1 TaxID=2500526 RepID=UPI000FDB89FD|nr:GntR family transcriptional regulator [Mesorhizobium sp. M2E.F.Ca.ET.209.01.1.1]TGS18029.1 GntR family transcriptional regulator [Mesorhizobium sp. M2E.F.Ca.ET.209.01.1.1]
MNEEGNFALPPRRRLTDEAYDLIKNDVILCRLKPGAEVTEAGLANHYRLGLAPIRSALSRLSQEGLVNTIPRRGYIVAPVSGRTANDVFDLRMLLEPAAAYAAAGRVDEKALRTLGAGPFLRDDTPDDLQFLKNNRDFHVEIARASGNERMARVIESLLDEMQRLLHIGLFSSQDRQRLLLDHELQRQQHEELIDALVAGDAKASENAALRHVRHSRELVMNALGSILSVTL